MTSLDEVRRACAEEREKNVEIAELCLAARRFDLAAGFIESGKSARVVQRELAELTKPKPATDPSPRGAFDPAWIERELAAGRALQ